MRKGNLFQVVGVSLVLAACSAQEPQSVPGTVPPVETHLEVEPESLPEEGTTEDAITSIVPSREWKVQAAPAQDEISREVSRWLSHNPLAETPIVPEPARLQENDGWVADWGIWAQMSTEQARKQYEQIPRELALVYGYGSGKHELVVFSDPYAQADRRLMALLDKAGSNLDATIYVFPLPADIRVGNVERILCTRNPASAWRAWMRHVAPSPLDLDNLYFPRLPAEEEAKRWARWEKAHPVVEGCQASERAEAIGQLASDLGVSFTPTVVFAHGRAWPNPLLELDNIRSSWEFVSRRLDLEPMPRPASALDYDLDLGGPQDVFGR